MSEWDGEEREGMMYDFNFRRTLVQKPAVLTVCPSVFFPGRWYTYLCIVMRKNNMQDCFYHRPLPVSFSITLPFFLQKIYSSITFRVYPLPRMVCTYPSRRAKRDRRKTKCTYNAFVFFVYFNHLKMQKHHLVKLLYTVQNYYYLSPRLYSYKLLCVQCPNSIL